jgi:hypothetical protein
MARNIGNSGPSYGSAMLRDKADAFLGVFLHVGYNLGFDFNYKTLPQTMEAERINALSALLNDLTSREAELRRYL